MSDLAADVDRLVDVPETARLLSVSKATVYRMIHDGELQPVKVRNKIRLPLDGYSPSWTRREGDVMVLTVLAVALPFLPLALALRYARRADEWSSITDRERVSRALQSSVPVSAWTYGAGVRAGTAPHGAGADASRATSCLASEGRPATAPISSLRAKVDRPIPLPRMAMASRDAAGDFSTGHPVT